MQRFYSAFDSCVVNKLIKSISTYLKDNDIDKRHFYAQRKDLDKGYFEVSWLVPLIEDYGVSSRWLLTGKGSMLTRKAANSRVALHPICM